jgi:membrane-bound lytic murein transglycosylase D
MKQNYAILGDWPLAITAYNHGTTGVARAARETGSRNIADIIDRFENKSFGFASQNFYACFLAALHVARNSEAYLGLVPRAKKLEFDEFVMPDFMLLQDFLAKMEIDDTVFRELNPALTEEVYSGAKYIPVGYIVRVPMEASAGFLGRYEEIPSSLKHPAQRTSVAGTPPAGAPEAPPPPDEAGRLPASAPSPVTAALPGTPGN